MTIDNKDDSETEKAIKVLAGKSGGAVTSHEAMQFAQAALNLAHTQQVLAQTKRNSSQE